MKGAFFRLNNGREERFFVFVVAVQTASHLHSCFGVCHSFNEAEDIFSQLDEHVAAVNFGYGSQNVTANRIFSDKGVNGKGYRSNDNFCQQAFLAVFDDWDDFNLNTISFFENLVKVDAFSVDVIPCDACFSVLVEDVKKHSVVFYSFYVGEDDVFQPEAGAEESFFHNWYIERVNNRDSNL